MQQKIKQGEKIQRPGGRETCQEPNSPGQTVQAKTKMNSTGIPEGIKQKYESISGFSFSDVQVHYNSHKPAQLQALAYTQGNDVYMAPGQERHLEHELGHVVQQKAGMVTATTSIGGMAVNDDPELERQADQIGRPVMQMKRESVVQRMRLCLNDIESDVELFRNARKVPVSPKGDKELSPGLQPLFNSHNAKDAVNEDPVDIIRRDYTHHNTPEEGKYTLESDEDIVVEAHGVEVDAGTDPMDNGTLANIIIFTAGFIRFCGYSSGDPWNGRVIWFGCSTGRQSQMIADQISQIVGFPVRVVGTKKNIRVPQGMDGAYYAAEEWDDADPGAPVNCGEILTFYHALIEASFRDNLWKAQEVALKIKGESSKAGYAADAGDITELKRLIAAFRALTLPAQPAYADFSGRNIPVELQRLPIVDNKIYISQNQVSNITAHIIKGLNALGANMVKLNPANISKISDIILSDLNNIYKFTNYFGLAAQRKIDFNNPGDVIEAIGVIPAPAQPVQTGEPDQPDTVPQGAGE